MLTSQGSPHQNSSVLHLTKQERIVLQALLINARQVPAQLWIRILLTPQEAELALRTELNTTKVSQIANSQTTYG